MSAPDADGRVLQEDVREGLLRGVRVDVALRNFGQCFSTPGGSLAAMTDGDLAMSKVTKKLDDFISHDWQTRRWPKLLALCVVYNGDAALFGSCAVAVAVTVLENEPIGLLPKSAEIVGVPDQLTLHMHGAPWGFFSALATFWVLLLFGQRLRALMGRGRVVFLDRLCINQLDEQEKCEGIASLAGFMRHSDRLLVLWSPRYFTRLWCVYEMATWLHLGKSLQASMDFMPVGFAVGLVLLNIQGSFLSLLIFIAYLMPQVLDKYKVGVILVALSAPWQVHTVRCLGSELRQLVSQLERFSIWNADCWCCSQAHTHPVSGDRLLCDRALVHRTLHARQSSAGSTSEALEQFDLTVRTTFKDVVSAAFGTLRVDYRQALFLAAPAAWGFPELCSSVDHFADRLRGFRYVAGYCALFLCIVPVTMRVGLAVAAFSVRVCPPKRSILIDVALSVGISLILPLLGGLQWLAMIGAMSKRGGAPQLGLLLGEVALTILCFCRPPRCIGAGSSGAATAPSCCSRARRKEQPNLAAAAECGEGMGPQETELN